MNRTINTGTTFIDFSCYDWTLKWMIDTEALTWDKIPKMTCSVGECRHHRVSYIDNEGNTKNSSDGKMLTGQSEETKLNNIYDLSGLKSEIMLAYKSASGGYSIGTNRCGLNAIIGCPISKTKVDAKEYATRCVMYIR